jgi:hypothetical protein
LALREWRKEENKMRKTAKIIGLLSIIALLISGCCLGERKEQSGSGTFVCIGSDKGIPVWNRVLYDKETRVMYVNTDDGICVMLNADGTPKLYTEE